MSFKNLTSNNVSSNTTSGFFGYGLADEGLVLDITTMHNQVLEAAKEVAKDVIEVEAIQVEVEAVKEYVDNSIIAIGEAVTHIEGQITVVEGLVLEAKAQADNAAGSATSSQTSADLAAEQAHAADLAAKASKESAIGSQEQVALAAAQVVLAKQEVANAAKQVELASDQVDLAKAQVVLAKGEADSSKEYADKSQEIYEAFAKGAVYRGGWNPMLTPKYPNAEGVNSQWDVYLNDGTTVFVWNGIKWYGGDRLIYSIPDAQYFHINRVAGVLSVNGKTGAVNLTAANVGAVAVGETVANATTAQLLGDTNLNKTSTALTTIPDIEWYGDKSVGHSQMIKTDSVGLPSATHGYVFKYAARDVDKGSSWFFSSDYTGNASGLWHGTSHDSGEAPKWSRIYTERYKPTWADVGGSAYMTTSGPNYAVGSGRYLQASSPERGFIPYASGEGGGANGYLGLEHWWFKEAWVHTYRGGSVNVTGDVNAGGEVKENGVRVYSHNNRPTAADVGALPLAGGKLTGTIDTSSLNVTDYSESRLSTAAQGSKVYLRKFRGGSSDSIWHETVQGGTYRLAIGNTDSAERFRVTSDGYGFLGGSRIYTTDNKPTAADVGALSTRGGEVSGSIIMMNPETFVGARLDITSSSDTAIFECGTNAPFSKDNVKFTGTTGPLDKFNIEMAGGAFPTVNGQEIYSKGNKPTAIEVGALPITGGALTGTLETTNNIAYKVNTTGSTTRGAQYFNKSGTSMALSGALWTGTASSINNFFFGQYRGSQDSPWTKTRPESWLYVGPAGDVYVAGHRVYHEGFKPPTAVSSDDILGGFKHTITDGGKTLNLFTS